MSAAKVTMGIMITDNGLMEKLPDHPTATEVRQWSGETAARIRATRPEAYARLEKMRRDFSEAMGLTWYEWFCRYTVTQYCIEKLCGPMGRIIR